MTTRFGSIDGWPLVTRWFLAGALGAMICVAARSEVRVLEAGGLGAESAALIVSDQQGGALPVVVRAEARWQRPIGLDLTIEIDGFAASPPASADAVFVELYLYVLGSKGEVVSSLLKVVEVTGDDRVTLSQAGLRFFHPLNLAGGIYQMRLLVRERDSGRLALRSLPVQVTDPARGSGLQGDNATAALLTPRFAGLERWVSVASDGSPAKELPAAFPILAPKGKTDFTLIGSGLGQRPRLAFQFLTVDGDEVVFEVPARLRTIERPFSGGLSRWEVSVDLDDAVPGEYRARLLDRASGLSNSFSVLVDDRAGTRVWAELMSSAADREAQQAAREVPPPGADESSVAERDATRKLRMTKQEVTDRLAGVAYEFSKGKTARAREQAFHLISEALGGEGSLVRSLDKAASAAFERWGRTDRTIYLPLAALYSDVYFASRSVSAAFVATHCRRMVLALLDLHFASAPPEDRALGIDFLVVVASRFDAGGWHQRDQFIERALALSPTHPVALLAAAFSAESRGDFVSAVERLEVLVAEAPENQEARLRLALNEHRLGRADDFELLESVASSDSDWPRSVAYQELVRWHLRLESFDRAAAVLAEGLRTFPEDEKLLLLRTYLAAASVTTSRGAATDEAQPTGDSQPRKRRGMSPRVRYSTLSLSLLGEVSARLDSVVESRLPALRSVVEPLVEAVAAGGAH